MDPNSNVNYRRKIGPITDLKSKGIQSLYIFCLGRIIQLQRVPALRAFWDLEKTVLHEIRVSGTVVSPLLMWKSPCVGICIEICVGIGIGICLGIYEWGPRRSQEVPKGPRKSNEVPMEACPNKVPNDFPDEVTNEVPNDFPDEVTNEVPNEVPNKETCVGTCMGTCVGTCMGTSMGTCVGTCMGTWVGTCVGIWVGISEGICVGIWVGGSRRSQEAPQEVPQGSRYFGTFWGGI